MSSPTPPAPTATTTTTTESARFAPASTPSVDEFDPDVPLPSVERDVLSPDSTDRDSTPSEPIYTPTASSRASPARVAVFDNESIASQLENLRMRSVTPQIFNEGMGNHGSNHTSSGSPTPSIRFTPTPTRSVPPSRGSVGAISLLRGMHALDMSSRPSSVQRHASGESSSGRPPSDRARSPSVVNPTPYRVEDEEPPRSLFHERRLQEALLMSQEISKRMAQSLSSSPIHLEQGSTVGNLHQQAIDLSQYQLPTKRIVGLVGESGVGKSSLINSLLDKKDLARASNKGAACTCVVIEYHFHDRDDFVIEVDYFSVQELRDQFGLLICAYREHVTRKESNTSSDENKKHSDELEELKKKADLATSTFQSAFRDRFAQTPELLTSIPLKQALDIMTTWITQTLPTLELNDNDNSNLLRETFNCIEDLSARLSLLTSDWEERGSVCLWPFIRKIKVYLKAHVLSRGLVFADLPGLRDLNSARQNVAERYVRQCHQIFVVDKMGRAGTDVGIKEVFELAQRAMLTNVGIICTRSDDIIAAEAIRDWPAETSQIAEIEGLIMEAERQIEVLEGEIELGLDTEGSASSSKGSVYGLKYAEEKKKKAFEFELTRQLILLRNSKVSSELRDKYHDYLEGDNLAIFCVSNSIYRDNRGKPAQMAVPFLNLSGIPELRRHCISIVADSHLRAVTDYIRDEIPAFLRSVELWVQAGAGTVRLERKQEILDAVTTTKQQLDQLTWPVLHTYDLADSLHALFLQRLTVNMRQSAREWSLDAGYVSNSWRSYPSSSYSAFCRNYGTHTTVAVGSQCWNRAACATMISDTSQWKEELQEDIESHLSEMLQKLVGDFARTLSMLNTAGPNTRTALASLASALHHRRSLMRRGIENCIEDFEDRMYTLRTNAILPLRSSIIGQLMEGAYHAANMDYGRGSDLRRKDLITSTFSSPMFFSNYSRRFKEQFTTIAEELQQKIKDVIATQMTFIEADLNTLRDEHVVEESERNPEFRVSVAREVDSVKEKMKGINRTIDEVTGATREDTPMI